MLLEDQRLGAALNLWRHCRWRQRRRLILRRRRSNCGSWLAAPTGDSSPLDAVWAIFRAPARLTELQHCRPQKPYVKLDHSPLHARQAVPLTCTLCRDLISSADTILDMARCCDGVLQNLKHIQVSCDGLHQHVNRQTMPSLMRDARDLLRWHLKQLLSNAVSFLVS